MLEPRAPGPHLELLLLPPWKRRSLLYKVGRVGGGLLFSTASSSDSELEWQGEMEKCRFPGPTQEF